MVPTASLRTRKVTFMLPKLIAGSACRNLFTKDWDRSRRKIRASCGRQKNKRSQIGMDSAMTLKGETRNDKDSRTVCNGTDGCFVSGLRARRREERNSGLDRFGKATGGH